MTQGPLLQNSVSDQAALWLVRASSGEFTRSERAELEAWLQESSTHRQAYDDVRVLSDDIDLLGAIASESERFLQPELEMAVAECKIALRKHKAPSRHTFFLKPPIAIAASLFLVFFGLLAGFILSSPLGSSPKIYTTSVAEQRTVMLSDGSLVTLSADTTLSAALTPSVRRLRLTKGEAYFDVAKDPTRPFTITINNGVVKALGTAFNIEHRDRDMKVTVFEGLVEVQKNLSHAEKTTSTLAVGERMTIDNKKVAIDKLTPRELERVAAWREGKLIFDGDTLVNVVQAMQPYLHERIVIAEKSLTTLTLGGAFRTSDVKGFLTALESGLPVRIERQPGIILITKRRG